MALKFLAAHFLARKSFCSSYPVIGSRKLLGTMAENQAFDIKFEELKDKVIKRAVILIDVREPKELKEDGKIPNSLNIPLGQIAEAFQLSDADFQAKYHTPKPHFESSDIVLSCRSGKRASNAFSTIQTLGFKNATVYYGSFQDWVKNGGPIEK